MAKHIKNAQTAPNVPCNHIEQGKKLGIWVSKQRLKKRKTTLDQRRVGLLEETGVEWRSKKRRKKESPRCCCWNYEQEEECNCDDLSSSRPVFTNFRSACQHYGFPGSHQIGSYGPKGQGIVRSYSNGLQNKDKVLGEDGDVVLYRLKKNNESLRAQFLINLNDKSRKVRVFRKVEKGVLDLGLFFVNGIVAANKGDHVDQFGDEFIEFVRSV
mmetsp:Transcript_7054/g.11158  ORF Transcript_7054/g.11158 Transcript_7054/m.11158 type:complete len:213 (-) Transcript_7054:3-641(-)